MNLYRKSCFVIALLIVGCASSKKQDDSTVQMYQPKGAAHLPPVMVNNVKFSVYPPQGKSDVIAYLACEGKDQETDLHIIYRLQQKAAELGADYIVITRIDSKRKIIQGKSGYKTSWPDPSAPPASPTPDLFPTPVPTPAPSEHGHVLEVVGDALANNSDNLDLGNLIPVIQSNDKPNQVLDLEVFNAEARKVTGPAIPDKTKKPSVSPAITGE